MLYSFFHLHTPPPRRPLFTPKEKYPQLSTMGKCDLAANNIGARGDAVRKRIEEARGASEHPVRQAETSLRCVCVVKKSPPPTTPVVRALKSFSKGV